MVKSRIHMQDDDGNWRIPNEVLIHIAKLVDDRQNLGISCGKFYSIVCDIEKPKMLKINIDKAKIMSRQRFMSLNSHFRMIHFSWKTRKLSYR